MTKYILMALLASVMIWSCEDKLEENGESKSLVLKQNIEVSVGECVSDDNHLQLCVDSVSADGRCPSDLVCVWEGNATVKVRFKVNSRVHQLLLNTSDSNDSPADTTIDQYHIQLKELTPYPISNSTIDQKDYQALIVVSEMAD